MPYDTIVTWNPLPDELERTTLLDPKSQAMTDQGLTDGTYQISSPNGPGVPPSIITRTWTTLEAAQEWKSFCEAATPIAPESVTIPI